MAARSVTVNFVNNSDVALILDSASLSHGIWTTQPPVRIEAGTTVSWESESSGVATGTEGEATFKIETGPGQTDGSAHFHWDNPFVGSNSYDEATPVLPIVRDAVTSCGRTIECPVQRDGELDIRLFVRNL